MRASGVLLIRADDLARACSMADAIDAVAVGFVALSDGRARVPLRGHLPLADDALALTMPASLDGSPYFAVKVVTVTPRAAPAVRATVLLGDARTGEPLAIVEGTALTALRTGAAGGVAARALARGDASVLALYGAGTQARTQLLAAAAVRPLRAVRVVARDPAHTSAFVDWAAAQPSLAGVDIRAADARRALDGATLVVTATTSETPVFPGARLADGAHVTAVGAFQPTARELDADAIAGARVVVDQRDAAFAEAGEVQGLSRDAVAEIGEVLAGRAPGRRDARERTVFKSVGNAVQDLVVAALAYERARALGIGEEARWP